MIVVVGAGLAGLSAAARLSAAGHVVVAVDKGRGVGGRMATRRIGSATLDHGAQFFTVRSPELASLVAGWEREGLVVEWCRGFGDPPDGYPRYAVRGGMSALAKHLAGGIDVRTSTMAFAIRQGFGRQGRNAPWSVAIDDGTTIDADAVIVTTPLPQALALTITAGIELPEALRTADYDRTIALLAVLDGPPAVPEPGAVQNGDPVFSMIVDNARKGVSAVPAVTMHASAEWSLAWWDEPRADTHRALLGAATRWLGSARVVESHVKRWRFATPQRIWPERYWRAPSAAGDAPDAPYAPGPPGPLVLAGDAFAGPRVEGAVLSGMAAADVVSSELGSGS